jgi:hypothetical protein
MSEVERSHIRHRLLLKLVKSQLMSDKKNFDLIKIKKIESTLNNRNYRRIIRGKAFKNHIDVMLNRNRIANRGEFINSFTNSKQEFFDGGTGECVSA